MSEIALDHESIGAILEVNRVKEGRGKRSYSGVSPKTILSVLGVA